MSLIEREAALKAIKELINISEPDGKQYTTAMAAYDLIMLMEEAQPSDCRTEWRDAEIEVPPKPGMRVLLTDGIFVGEGYIDDEGKWKRYYAGDVKEVLGVEVTHWMPLPEPPKEMMLALKGVSIRET